MKLKTTKHSTRAFYEKKKKKKTNNLFGQPSNSFQISELSSAEWICLSEQTFNYAT